MSKFPPIVFKIDDVKLDEWLVDEIMGCKQRDDETIQEIIARLLAKAVSE